MSNLNEFDPYSLNGIEDCDIALEYSTLATAGVNMNGAVEPGAVEAAAMNEICAEECGGGVCAVSGISVDLLNGVIVE